MRIVEKLILKNMKHFILILAVLLLAACGKQAEEEAELVKYDATAGADLTSVGLFEDIEIVPLETQDSILIGESELLVFDNDYYVVDKIGNKVLRFGADGRFMNQIGRVGHGPAEFTAVKSVSVVDGALCIYSSMDDAEYFYAQDGAFQRKKEMPCIAQQILHRGDELFFYLGFKNQYGEDRVIAADNSGAVIHKYLPSSADILTMVEDSPVLVPYGGSVFVKETVNNEIYSIEGAAARVAFRFDYGEYNIPSAYYEMSDAYEAGEYLFAREFATHSLFLTNKSWSILQAVIQKKDGTTLAYAIQNKASGMWTWCNYTMKTESDNVFAGSLKQLTDSEIYFMVEPRKLMKSELRNSPLLKNPDAIDALNENDNYVVLKCRLSN